MHINHILIKYGLIVYTYRYFTLFAKIENILFSVWIDAETYNMDVSATLNVTLLCFYSYKTLTIYAYSIS